MFTLAFGFLMFALFCFYMSRQFRKAAKNASLICYRCNYVGPRAAPDDSHFHGDDDNGEYNNYGEKIAMWLKNDHGRYHRYDLTLGLESPEGQKNFDDMIRFVNDKNSK